jgi:hypothetical protein
VGGRGVLATARQIADFVDNIEAFRRQGGKAARYLVAKRGLVLSPRGGAVIAAASAVAATAWAEMERRRIRSADVGAARVHIGNLYDLRFDRETLAIIERELRKEWGEFAFLGFPSLADLAASAGRMVLVASLLENGRQRPGAVLQTTLADVGGCATRLHDEFPTFADLVSPEALKRASSHGGDTVVLLQITVLDREERGGGLGSLLRNAALHMLRDEVRFALTTTPIDREGGANGIELSDSGTFTGAMKFHARGGAAPELILPGFKTAADLAIGSSHGADVIVMRYARDAAGAWPAPRPEDLRLHSLGPIEDGLLWTAARLRALTAYRERRPELQLEAV